MAPYQIFLRKKVVFFLFLCVAEELDEVVSEAGFAAGFRMKLVAAGAGRFDGPVQGLGPGFPVAL